MENRFAKYVTDYASEIEAELRAAPPADEAHDYAAEIEGELSGARNKAKAVRANRFEKYLPPGSPRRATITGPDGRKAVLNIPDGATQEQILSKAQEVKARWGELVGGNAPQPGASDGTSQSGSWLDTAQNVARGVGKSVLQSAEIAIPAIRGARMVAGIAQDPEGSLDAVTGSSRTEFPEAQEFLPAYMASGRDPETGNVNVGEGGINPASVMRSAVTPDPQAQLDILKKNIPGLESRLDQHGNIMLKAPGMDDWAYLNKPGFSGRDVDEFGTQTLATLPFLGLFGRGATLPARAAFGAAASGGASVTQDVAAMAQGSEQGVDPVRTGVSTAFGAGLAPGVPSAVATQAARAGAAMTRRARNAYRSVANPQEQARRNVTNAFAIDATGDNAPQVTGPQLEHLAQTRFATAAPDQDARIMDIGGERTRALARSAANMSPEGRETLMEVIQPRFETQSARAIEAIRRIAGTQGDATATQQGIETIASRVNPGLYRAAYRTGAGGLTSPALTRLTTAPAIERAMDHAGAQMANRQAIGRVQTGVNGPNGHPTLEMWDQVARALSDEEALLRSGSRMEEAANIGGLRQRLQAELDRLVPAFRTARGTAAEQFGASDALDAGRRVANGAFSMSDARDTVGQRIATGNWTPGQIHAAVTRMTPAEREMFREGYVSAWIDRLNRTGDNRNVIALLNGSNAVRQQLNAVLGPRRTRELEAYMLGERLIDRIRTAVGGNSTTARQWMELGLATGAAGTVASFDPNDPMTWVVAILVGGAARSGVRNVGARVDQRVALETARMLVSRDPDVFQRGVRTIANSPMLRALRDADLAFTGPTRGVAVRAATPAPGNAPSELSE